LTGSLLDAGQVATNVDDGVGTISFGHPKGNSLPAALLAQLATEVSTMGERPDVRVMVLRSEGNGPFCAGASFHELQAVKSAEEGTGFFMGFARLILAMVRCRKFIVARIHGKAVGGGVGVTAAADYAIAASGASVKLSELAVGIGPFVVGPVIERRIGTSAMSHLAIDATGWRDTTWAQEKGLYALVTDSVEELDQVVDRLVKQLAASNPDAMARMKEVFWAGTEHWEDLLPARAAMSGKLVMSEFAQKAIAKR